MPKLTDAAYFLPEIEGSEAGKILKSGRTRPMIIQGICKQTGFKSEYVVKFKGSEEMWEDSTLNELLGAWIGLELGLNIPEPVVVNVSKEFIETMKTHGNYKIATNSIGFNFGNVYHEAFQEFISGQPVSPVLKLKLLDLFAFDVLIGNTDRRVDKPNFLPNGKDLLIYDHELAFSFTKQLSFARNPQPWLILPIDLQWLNNNFCYNLLKGNSFDFSNFVTRMNVINGSFWQKAESFMPAEWKTKNFGIIKDYITMVIYHAADLGQELKRILL